MKEVGDNSKQNCALIIDDEVDICFLLKNILRQKSIPASYVTSISDAKLALQSTDPQIIFLDNHLQDGLGINYIREIKSEHPDSKLVMITAYDTAADRQRAYHEGVDVFIGKPFTREIILKTIESLDCNG